MEWSDEAIVLGLRRHGESSVIVEALTRHHGRHFGLVRGGRSARMQPLLQIGNELQLTWRARLEEHLGTYAVEALALHSAHLMGAAASLYGLTHLADLVRLLPERDAHEALYDKLQVVVMQLDAPERSGALMVRFEAALLAELGFGLDLEACAVTGATQELTHVSPKTGRAVSRVAAEPYRDRLLRLPRFLASAPSEAAEAEDVEDGVALTGYFLRRHVYEPRGLAEPEARHAFFMALRRGRQAAAEMTG